LKKKKKRLKVRFADEVEEIPEESLNVSDELIEMYEEESPPKRCRAGLFVKLIDSVSIPGDYMTFVAAKIPRKFTGNGAVKLNRCFHPGKEWMEEKFSRTSRTIETCAYGTRKSRFDSKRRKMCVCNVKSGAFGSRD
jgi:hypothetical protein